MKHLEGRHAAFAQRAAKGVQHVVGAAHVETCAAVEKVRIKMVRGQPTRRMMVDVLRPWSAVEIADGYTVVCGADCVDPVFEQVLFAIARSVVKVDFRAAAAGDLFQQTHERSDANAGGDQDNGEFVLDRQRELTVGRAGVEQVARF